ncbi:MAG: DUF2202 domain-containing protein [Gammaproteobacteria bacterium]|nr:DUF2202 domain-containing protein [Gammaproteobacteria bacterium]
MKYLHRFTQPLIIIFLTLPFYITVEVRADTISGANKTSSINKTIRHNKVNNLRKGNLIAELSNGLDATEISHLTFIREEEKLARDVYLTLADLYPDQRVFNRIATRSEQTHTDTMRDKLDQFNVPDPNPETNNLPDSIGVFTGNDWGWYFTEKFDLLTAKGEISELDALYVGALIEELDMHDIAICPQVMVDRGFSSPCGLAYTDEDALITAYSALMSGSESHLRAYVGQIEAVIGAGNYKAQYLTQAEVDVLLGR